MKTKTHQVGTVAGTCCWDKCKFLSVFGKNQQAANCPSGGAKSSYRLLRRGGANGIRRRRLAVAGLLLLLGPAAAITRPLGSGHVLSLMTHQLFNSLWPAGDLKQSAELNFPTGSKFISLVFEVNASTWIHYDYFIENSSLMCGRHEYFSEIDENSQITFLQFLYEMRHLRHFNVETAVLKLTTGHVFDTWN